MESPSTTLSDLGLSLDSGDESQRVKLLCSFSGSILPRPQDGKLRYVGGETRILSVPRDVKYEDLMGRMRELSEGMAVLKYQQPDEDLDALVSVVNDNDVTNMMEEYDKFCAGNGFTKLRIFLCLHPDQDVSPHFVDGDEWDNERRYVDALNNSSDSCEYRMHPLHESHQMSSIDEAHVPEQFFCMHLEDSPHSQRNFDMQMPHMNLHHLNIPHLESAQVQQPNSQRYGDMEAPWSPTHCSPGHCGHDGPKSSADFPSSPSSGRPHMPFAEYSDHRLPEEFNRQQVNQQMPFEHQPQYSENFVRLAGFPGDILHTSGAVEGNSICEHSRMIYQRNQPPVEQPNVASGFRQVVIPCANCYSNHDRGRFSNHRLGPLAEDPRVPVRDWHYTSSNYAHHEGTVYLRPETELGNNNLSVPGPLPALEEHPIGYGNSPYGYGTESSYEFQHGHVPARASWRNIQSSLHGYEGSPSLLANGTVNPICVRRTLGGSPSFHVGMGSQNTWVGVSSKIPRYDLFSMAERPNGHDLRSDPNIRNQLSVTTEPFPPDIVNIATSSGTADLTVSSLTSGDYKLPLNDLEPRNDTCANDTVDLDKKAGGKNPHAVAENVALDNVEKVAPGSQEHTDSAPLHNSTAIEAISDKLLNANVQGDLKLSSNNGNTAEIEPTNAEAEAIARGLQTIRNNDLEVIRELGSGTYGAVYHGKWKGSDVAIKRIKASCFAAKSSERQRLISDFWKEALLTSSLHHPNVVSFYGIVRDGPDGSLATVTEYMINGSLKQFLQKKDRTIDRRKRLIIAMDAAFGMEYLHGKNIVHFDLKCENLLVNMKDAQRPVCKIGDLGLSKVKQHTLVSGGVRGTLPWMAPELLSGKSSMVSEKIDVYSFGIVMWEVLTGDAPYGDMHYASIIGGIVKNILRPEIPTWCDPEWKSLMESCWASNPAERPSFSEISQRLRNMAAAMNVK